MKRREPRIMLKFSLQGLVLIFIWSAICLPLTALPFRVLFTSSLNGKLEGCTCEKNPASGLAKRAYIINQYRKKYPAAILLDAGDNLADSLEPLLLEYTFKGLSAMRYDGMVFGDQDLYSGMEDFKRFQQEYKLPFLDNFIKLSGFSDFRHQVNIIRGNKKLVVIAYSDANAYKFFPGAFKGNLSFQNLAKLQKKIQELRKTNSYIILLSHSGLEIDKKIAVGAYVPDLIISGHDQSHLKKPLYLGKCAIVSNGMNGYFIGEIVIEKNQVIQYRLIPTPYDKTNDEPEIKKIVDQYLEMKKNLFK
jgi:5'-nucleotidase